MAITDLVRAARKNTPTYVRPADPNAPIKNLVDLSDSSVATKAAGGMIDGESIGPKFNENVDWENCKFRKPLGGKDTCTQFFIHCRKENCNNKFIKK
ncbi:MAG: hypothetical protein AABW72_04040 [archaeon]